MNEETYEIQTDETNQTSDVPNQEQNTEIQEVTPANELPSETLNYYSNVCNIGLFLLFALGCIGGLIIGIKFIEGLWSN